MIIYPAIDLHDGQVVRLKEGDPSRQTTFSNDPIAVAHNWIEQGATWLHVVNLDGAFSKANNNERILEKIARLNTNVQFGGGVRTIKDIERAFSLGATRVILGTIAVEQPAIVAQAINRWGAGHICVALDARNGKVATHGWQQVTDFTPVALGRHLAQNGLHHALYTDVTRDGRLSGVNIEATVNLASQTGLQIIASGGVRDLDDICQLTETKSVAGAIVGMALYSNRVKLADALAIAGD